MTTLGDLEKLVRKRNRLMQRNDALAARDPQFATRLWQARNANDLDWRAAQAVQAAYGQSMGSLTAIAIGSVAAVSLVTAVTFVYWQIQREEREFAAANPIQATLQSAMSSVWAIVLLGGLAIGGLMYWDYRQGGGGRGGRRERPFEGRRRDERRELGRELRGVRKEARELLPSRASTLEDPQLGRRVKEDWELEEQLAKTDIDPSLAERFEHLEAMERSSEKVRTIPLRRRTRR